MRMVDPDICMKETPKALCRRLVSFCKDHEIPEEIVRPVVSLLYTCIAIGCLRPITFTGENDKTAY